MLDLMKSISTLAFALLFLLGSVAALLGAVTLVQTWMNLQHQEQLLVRTPGLAGFLLWRSRRRRTSPDPALAADPSLARSWRAWTSWPRRLALVNARDAQLSLADRAVRDTVLAVVELRRTPPRHP